MYAIDFEYDGIKLSEKGYILCEIGGSSGCSTVSNGATISYNLIQRHSGKKYGLISTTYDDYIEATFQICKNPDTHTDLSISDSEIRDLSKWLSRRELLEFHFIPEVETDTPVYYNAGFNLEKIVSGTEVCGLSLTMITDSPFGHGETITATINGIAGSTETITCISDEIGFLYPIITITCKDDGDLTITNESFDSSMEIKNVCAGEILQIDGDSLIITSSLESHELYNDFNFEFLKIGCPSYTESENKISFSLDCDLTLSYEPIIKLAPN